MGRRQREIPKEIALTPVKVAVLPLLHPPGMAIFNPLVDAPPDPPPIASYQHQQVDTRDDQVVEDCEQGQAPSGHHRRPSNYYYSSQQAVPQHATIEYKEIDYDLLERERERHQRFRCRILILMLVLVYASWSRPDHDSVPKTPPGQASMDFVHKDAILSNLASASTKDEEDGSWRQWGDNATTIIYEEMATDDSNYTNMDDIHHEDSLDDASDESSPTEAKAKSDP
mmetsp:Transcript_39028/g.112100  ORF Transcript_39028/g.112100 Transcript_39028/m.112100 type:complete len:227 (+) Transcript_39028:249-929(+)|eukprot:CAMPEP_0176021304 /NCGR_PEP_ID=MMETSP0120_2-20121206/10342_1 /TAXON_ID=160619 /ORGANISM="Kryptoperidinium foliaceum, Strain CCMP 1326" /LENGTH=226 /DNA_ID=CAMNT_0017354417 /DNA_START=225 /DNA_END=905 /DNA_ORIENTATION=-